MPIRKTQIKATAGVKLTRVDQLSANQKVVSTHYTVSTLRPEQPRVLGNEDTALQAFDLEVIASLSDPLVQRLAALDR